MAKNRIKPLGSGMKPRVINTGAAPNAASDAMEVSTDTVREVGAIHAASEHNGALESVIGSSEVIAESTEPAESEAEVADSMAPGVKEHGDAQPSLDELLKSSEVDRVDLYHADTQGGYTLSLAMDSDTAGRLLVHQEPLLGQRQDGTYGVVIGIAEGYIEGVKQQAESDNMTIEAWLEQKLNEYLEQWWFAAGQR